MDENAQGEEIKPTKSALTAVLAGLIVIALGLFTYRYFTGSQGQLLGGGDNIQKLGDINSSDETDTLGDDVYQIDDTSMQNGLGYQTEGGVLAAALENASKTFWVANDYKQGDVTGSTYTVKSGDTLWEIAEARYGDGSQWGKILEANSDKIGFLADGSQALIFPGQTLSLP